MKRFCELNDWRRSGVRGQYFRRRTQKWPFWIQINTSEWLNRFRTAASLYIFVRERRTVWFTESVCAGHIHYSNHNLNKFTFFTSPAKLQQVLLVNPNTPITRRNGCSRRKHLPENHNRAVYFSGSDHQSARVILPYLQKHQNFPSFRRQTDTSFRGEGISCDRLGFHQSIKLSVSTETFRRAWRCLFSFPSFICLVKRRRLKRSRTSAEH